MDPTFYEAVNATCNTLQLLVLAWISYRLKWTLDRVNRRIDD